MRVADWQLDQATFANLINDPGVQKVLDQRAAAGEAAASAACPRDTNHLATTIRTVHRGAGRRVEYGNDTTASYAPYVEWGTRPHIIRPKNAQALWWPGAAHPVKVVHHPGTPAHYVMSGAALDAARRP